MEPLNILYKYLTEINKKYENTSFVDIDFIKLFGLREKSDNLKKIITTKYYNLALKYHPDKHTNSTEIIINIINCFVNIEEIKAGQFLSFINDIYNMLLNIIKDDQQILFNLINGETEELLNKFDLNSDFNNLKRRYNRNIDKEYYKPNEEQMNEFNNEIKNQSIIEIKLDSYKMESLINSEQEKRNNLKIEKIFTEEEQQSEKFKEIFNNKFDNNIEIDEIITTIQPFNFNDSNLTLIGTNNNISEINEAFEPIRVNKKIKENLSYDKLIEERDLQDKFFKIPIKKNT
jgi:hypothetical protein